MTYMNKRNGQVAKVVERNEKFKTVMLEYVADGKTISVTEPTFKRWWKKVEDEQTQEQDAYVEEIMQQKEDLGIEVPVIDPEQVKLVPMPGSEKLADLKDEYAGDGTPLAEVGKEIAAQAKEKAKKAKAANRKPRQLKQEAAHIAEDKQWIYDQVTAYGDEIFSPAKDIKMNAFKVGGHMYCKFNYSKSSLTIAVKPEVLSEDMAQPTSTINHMFGAVYKFNDKLSSEDKKLVKKLLKAARNYRISKNKKSVKKEDK